MSSQAIIREEGVEPSMFTTWVSDLQSDAIATMLLTEILSYIIINHIYHLLSFCCKFAICLQLSKSQYTRRDSNSHNLASKASMYTISITGAYICLFFKVTRMHLMGVEPILCYQNRSLNPACLPISPQAHNFKMCLIIVRVA